MGIGMDCLATAFNKNHFLFTGRKKKQNYVIDGYVPLLRNFVVQYFFKLSLSVITEVTQRFNETGCH